MTQTILFSPLVPWALLAGAGLLSALMVGLALWRGLPGWWLRGLGLSLLLVALANPSLQSENRAPLSDIVLMVVDETASQGLSDRPDQTAAAAEELARRVAALPNTELRRTTLRDGAGDAGTRLMAALAEARANEPQGRIAGALLITDGQVHDTEATPDMPAPVHAVLTGRSRDWDRRLEIRNAPAFAILGEQVVLTLRIEDQGAVPATEGSGGRVQVNVSIDGGEPLAFQVPTGRDIELPVTLPHAGLNVLRFELPAAEGELTDRNNAAVVQINGVRDRLRVLLVSGEPHAGERTWRNLLKSDAAVDLVHFTILRPPEKQDGVPIDELSLISFPTRELFLDKIDEFDLIIFDRYKRRGILPPFYLENVVDYVRKGGAVLVATGPDFATADSLYRSPLAAALPASPTSRVIERGFTPRISDVGQRHPVTAGLDAAGAADVAESRAPDTGDDPPPWGRWFRQVELDQTSGHAVMRGLDDRPLLVLDRVEEGRVALLASDQAWLWDRGFEGGGPQLELLRRLAHWMMKEPELEEDALMLSAEGQRIHIARRMLEGAPGPATVTAPDGSTRQVDLSETEPGLHTATVEGGQMGLYRVTEGLREAVIALGPAAPREFEETIAVAGPLQPLTQARRGGIRRIEEGIPTLRQVREGRAAAGRNWLGITPRGAYVTTDVRLLPLVSGWLFLLLAVGLMLGAWLREGRR
ncbi:hypothetical protein BV394_07625 [Brevirhabdus pacifica]|uniref:Uncharacterized protein n=2 Tax=Brevirhabdus pacifica TaxID=1267768 RepID=A0A1U7DIA1_9RHOB|nr:hypothetical protein [Brevirhabdus pacifica]APX89598.1 hypothetical protein BV394_07625 [Brevirhabdus pacifica]OWU74288.1 membrane protein [Loktanella sp. 22II-4b]PJJ85732.1 hypothetical protein CLV77_0260 [Brevirhabdus pacifica]